MGKKDKTKDFGDEIELIEDTATSNLINKGQLLAFHLNRINRISCTDPINKNLYCNAVEQLEASLTADIRENKNFTGEKAKLEKKFANWFAKIPKMRQGEMLEEYKYTYFKELFKLLDILMDERGYYGIEYAR